MLDEDLLVEDIKVVSMLLVFELAIVLLLLNLELLKLLPVQQVQFVSIYHQVGWFVMGWRTQMNQLRLSLRFRRNQQWLLV